MITDIIDRANALCMQIRLEKAQKAARAAKQLADWDEFERRNRALPKHFQVD